jgi:hypothetical protein
MSALPPEADMLIVGINVCFVPNPDSCAAANSDYPISSAASESGSAEVAMHYAFAACD